MALDPADYTVKELESELEDVEDEGELQEILDAEKDGKGRTTAVAAIEARLDAVTGADEGEAADEDVQEEPEGSVEKPAAAKQAVDVMGLADDLPEGLEHPTADKKHVRALVGGTYRDMWVYCETQAGELIDVSKEMLGKARELIDQYNEDYDADERVVGVVIGDNASDLADDVIAYGADVAVYHEDDRLERFQHKPYTEIVSDMSRADADWRDYDKPRYFLFPATNNGRDLSAQVQAELDSGLASDCSDLYITDELISNPVKTGEPGVKVEFERVLHMKRPDFSGFEYSTILCLDNPSREFHPQGASVIPGSFPVPEADDDRVGLIVDHDLDLPDDWFKVHVTGHEELDEGVDLTGREVIVAVGRGIGKDPTKGLELALDLVKQFDDADLGLSRGVVTASYKVGGHVEQYVAEERQIGETGQVVAPPLYIAAGISGAVQHKVGMDESDTIISINTDPDARIRDFSDYFIEGDLFEVLPQLTQALESGELNLKALADGRGDSQ
ncbi:electron transfer flavoprotein subunit alpha/FixB family protein [Haladaptatus sp. YSMS36]|uniref:electron transfer flavoprotein subunit alpha/FixB family protein n=1 Tax=Haladaptatus sp. YSMS36 TaxID=3033384 RepID=UPI0023E8201D|nr:electron transfer flavoprotein subunit alpha/FixB family protein [Haladaptatus sp. YSMS36]